MNNIEENISVTSEDSNESIAFHIREKQITNQQPWNKEEIVFALSNLPAGEHALSVISTLHGDVLRKALDEFSSTDCNEVTRDVPKASTQSFANGYNDLYIRNRNNCIQCNSIPV